MKQNEKTGFLALLSVCGVFFLLRFVFLSFGCFTFEKTSMTEVAAMPFSAILKLAAENVGAPPLYYVLLKVWRAGGGGNIASLSYFSLIFETLALYPLIRICRTFKLSNSTISGIVLLTALNACLIKQSLTVNAESLSQFLALVSIWLFARFLVLGKNIWILTLINILLIYTSYFGWTILLSEVVAIIFLQRIKIRQILIMFGINMLSFAPWAFVLWSAGQNHVGEAAASRTPAGAKVNAFHQMVQNLLATVFESQPSSETMLTAFAALMCAVLVGALVIFYLDELNHKNDLEKQAFTLLAILTAAPVLLTLLANYIVPQYALSWSNLSFVLIPVAIFLGLAVDDRRSAVAKYIFIAVALISAASLAIDVRRQNFTDLQCRASKILPRRVR